MGATQAVLPARASSASRRVAWWALLLAVLAGHAIVTVWLQSNLVGWGAGDAPMPPRLEVAFVQALAPAAPFTAPPAATRRTRKLARAQAVAPAVSAAVATVEAVAPLPELVLPEPLPALIPQPLAVARAAEPASAATSAPASPSAVATPTGEASAAAPTDAAVAAFEWPPSTRLTYKLTGNYRGEVHGNARVQWVRQGARYQVHLDLSIGPSFAPLITRRMTSDGELGEQGLTPHRYDEATRLPFQQTRRVTVQFTPQQVTLGNGSVQDALPGVQDAASQFVQMTWLFTTRPELLRAGNTVSLSLALPRRMDRWIYDVVGQERLTTPIGEIEAFHLRPRLGERRPGNELSAEIWFAPTLQYLPVRIRIQQDADTFIDLVLDALPLQAAPEGPASSPR